MSIEARAHFELICDACGCALTDCNERYYAKEKTSLLGLAKESEWTIDQSGHFCRTCSEKRQREKESMSDLPDTTQAMISPFHALHGKGYSNDELPRSGTSPYRLS